MDGRILFKRMCAALGCALLLSLCLSGCMGKKAASFSVTDSNQTQAKSDTVSNLTSVSDKNGWKTRYDAYIFDMTHSVNDVIFTYKGEGGGSDELTIGFIENRMPEDVLYEVTADVDDSLVERYEGFFNAAGGDWCFGRHIARQGNGTAERAYTAVEHNGGTLLITQKSVPMTDQASQNEVDSAILEIRSNFAWTDHQPQKEFDYVAGTYVRTYEEEIEGKKTEVTDTVVMNTDHTGKLSFQDDITTYWTSFEVVENESGNRYEYSVEGDVLYLNTGDDWMEFEKKK